jgi:tRNA threonylcarbamoyl adenosine modification protein (Sua5/YciO/YrdC/YwlC family)
VRTIPIAGDPSPDVLDAIAASLMSGQIVLLPTDTIYGLHAVAGNEAAVAKIAAIKGRDEGKRFVVIAASTDQLLEYGASIPDVLRSVWPAPLTAVVPHPSGSVAVRVPNLGWLRALLERTGPLVSTSANRSGEPPIRVPSELARELQQQIDSALDAGPSEGKASTIVDFTWNEPRFIREGEPTFAQFLRKTLRKTL